MNHRVIEESHRNVAPVLLGNKMFSPLTDFPNYQSELSRAPQLVAHICAIFLFYVGGEI